MTKPLKVEPALEEILGEITALQKEVPGIGEEYLHELENYLQTNARKFPDGEERQKFVSEYARTVKNALKKAQDQGELSGAAIKQLKSLFRRMDAYQFITVLPVLTEEVHDCFVTPEGKVVRPYLMLPNQQKIPLY